jgi:hypothetical protein
LTETLEVESFLSAALFKREFLMDTNLESSVSIPSAEVQRVAAALATGQVVPAWVTFRDPMPGGTTLNLTITDVPRNWNVVSAWITEEGADHQPHAGAAIFYTNSVQKSTVGNFIRIIGSHNWGSPLHLGAMVLLGAA